MKNLVSTVTRFEVAIPTAIVVLLALPTGIAAHVAVESLILGGGIALAMTLRPRD
jgi:hypothetical protein